MNEYPNITRDAFDLYASIAQYGLDVDPQRIMKVIRQCIIAAPNEFAIDILLILLTGDSEN